MGIVAEITQRDIDLLLQRNHRVQIKFELIDDNYLVVDEMQGYVVSANFSIDNSSNIRRTSTLNLVVPNRNYLASNAALIWTDKMVRIYCGVADNLETDGYRWYLLGTTLMTDVRYNCTATDMSLQLQLVDMMSSTTQERGSQLGTETIVPAGSNVRSALIAAIALFSPFSNYSVVEFPDTIPYDQSVSVGSYPIDLLQSIINLFPTYEMYYSKDGTFTVNEIPTGIDDPIYIPKEIIDPLIISESRDNSLSNIKNTTEIWGRELDAEYTASSCTTSNGVYQLFIDDTFEALEPTNYAFVPDTTCIAGQKIKIQNTTEYGIYTQSGAGEYAEITAGAMVPDRMYCVTYIGEKFVLQGESIIHAIVQEIKATPSATAQTLYKSENNCNDIKWIVNADSPFAANENPVTHKIENDIRQVFSGGEYDAIYTTSLALERAAYENWKTTRWQDTVTISCLIIPWIDVNQKIEFTSPVTGEVDTYLVQKVSMDFKTWTMDVTCQVFYPVYPF